MLSIRRAFISLPFLLAAHIYFWPRHHILLGLLVDAIGVTIITWPMFRSR